MLDFLSGRLKERKAARAALIDQEALKLQRVEQLKGMVKLLKDLLKDTRYAAYTTLLTDTKTSLLNEREALLQTETDREAREHQVALLTGRIMQLEYILTTPEQFLALAESVEGNGSAARPQARQPVR
jgi:hypothetical protein